MSNLYQRKLSLAGINIAGLSEEDLRALVRKILDGKIHGLNKALDIYLDLVKEDL